MIYLKAGTIFSLLFFTSYFSSAQTIVKDHDHNKHENALFEIGISSGLVRIIEGKHTTAGFHTHITKRVSKKLPILVGIGYEYIIDEHQHHALGFVLGYSVIEDLTISISPGVTINEGKFTSHFEINYGFDIGKNIHLGPLLEYAYAKDDNHITVGLHLGILVHKRDKK